MSLKTLENQYREKLKERQKQIRVMRAKGLTWRAIGLELGITRQRAQQIGKASKMAKCQRCGGEMKQGKALMQTVSGSPDFADGEVVPLSPGGTGKLIDCLKCSSCGHSVNS